MKKLALLCLMATGLIACKEKAQESPVVEEMEVVSTDTEWISLFDGVTAEGWRGFNAEGGLPDGWKVEDSTLMSLGKGGDIGGDIVYEADTFGQFELTLDWKLSAQGNSGIFYHVIEGPGIESPYFAAPEYQIIDQKNFPEKLATWQSIGADYGMYDPTYNEADLKPIGEWNTSTIMFTNEKVVYTLNGKETLSFVPWSDDWKQRKSAGKWKDFPLYGSAQSGMIGLQDHGSPIWFKNIKIRKV